jgi:hypothetical protein
MFYYNTSYLKDDLIALKNANYFFITTFDSNIESNWIIHSGISINRDIERMKINQDNMKSMNTGNEIKLMLSGTITRKIKLKFGGDIYQKEYKRDYCPFEADTLYSWYFRSINTAIFAETDIDFNKFIAIKAGGRFENLSLSKESYVSPRLALAVKLSKISQVSLGYGWFTQQPQEDILVFDSYLKSEKAGHYILNYQIEKNSRIFRVEGYYKDYIKLIKYDSLYAVDPAAYSNTGNGYAQGIDIFYRDNKSIKNVNF